MTVFSQAMPTELNALELRIQFKRQSYGDVLSRQIETDIFNSMSKQASVSNCLKTYLPFWRARGLSITDVNMICHFLHSNGAFKELLAFSAENLEREEPVSWFYLTKTLFKFEANLKAPIYEALRNFIVDNRKLDEFTVSDLFDYFFPLEGEIKLNQVQLKLQAKERHRQTLLDQIRVFNQSRNYNIEKQTIQKFARLFPNDPQGKELQRRFETEDLQRFFLRYKNERQNSKRHSIDYFSDEEKGLLNKLFEQAQWACQKDAILNPDETAGYIYFFIFLEDFAHAHLLLPYMPEGQTKAWLQLELLLLNHKFAEGLAFLTELDGRFQNNPSFYPIKVYYVAQCFWGLGDRKKAIELMENLSQIKPDYRLASSLLKDWRSEL
jgi:hypothetical protein